MSSKELHFVNPKVAAILMMAALSNTLRKLLFGESTQVNYPEFHMLWLICHQSLDLELFHFLALFHIIG